LSFQFSYIVKRKNGLKYEPIRTETTKNQKILKVALSSATMFDIYTPPKIAPYTVTPITILAGKLIRPTMKNNVIDNP